MKNETAGQRIKQARLANGLSVREAAARIGMGKSSLHEIESGDSKFPSAEVLFKMAEVLGVTPRWIVHGENGELVTPTPEEESLLSSFRELPEESKKAVAAMVAAMKATSKT